MVIKINQPKDKQRILVMDNDRDMMMIMNRTLELEGYEAVMVGDYDEVVSLLEQMNPDMVIMNTFSSDEDIIQTLDIIRKQSDVPVVVITINNKIETLKEIFEHGADDFIRKPFGVKPFIARIRAKLRRYNGEILQPAT
ncbi:MAG: response regulator [Dehalococcoidales bacterium]|nr:response regulator [Dehalococcoidales bacterium]